MVLADFGSVWSFSYDLGRFPMVFARFRPVRGTGERANGRANPPRASASGGLLERARDFGGLR